MENIKSVRASEIRSILDRYSPFLSEARKRIFFTLFAFAGSWFIGFLLYEKIIKFLVKFLELTGINIVFTSPFQFINLSLSCGVATGLIVSLPILLIQILSFLRPALKESEYKIITKFLPFSFILFSIGFLSGAYIMKWQIQIFLERSVSIGIGNILDISRLLSTVILTSTLMGIGFQFPIILLLLLKMGILTSKQLAAKRKWVYLGSFFFALLLPPDSILADIFLSLPLIVLFELTLLLDKLQRGTAT